MLLCINVVLQELAELQAHMKEQDEGDDKVRLHKLEVYSEIEKHRVVLHAILLL
jgi:hypothetical protein